MGVYERFKRCVHTYLIPDENRYRTQCLLYRPSLKLIENVIFIEKELYPLFIYVTSNIVTFYVKQIRIPILYFLIDVYESDLCKNAQQFNLNLIQLLKNLFFFFPREVCSVFNSRSLTIQILLSEYNQ